MPNSLLRSEMALVTSQFDKNDKSVEALTSRNSVLTKEIDAQKSKIETLKSALDNAATSFGENDKRTQNWQIQLNKAQAELNGMERELVSNNKELDAAGRGFDEAGKGAGEFGKGLDSAGRETDQFGKALDGTGKNLDAAGKSTDKLGDTLSDTEDELRGAGKETDNLGNEMDETGKKASVFGDVLKATLAAEIIIAGAKALVNMVKEVGAAVKDYVSDGMQMATQATENQMKLSTVMKNTMDASDGQIRSIVELTNAQEKLGVVSATVQQGGAQELATYLSKTDSLKTLLPVMNDMLAQQYGINATQENAVNIATMLGKVMDGQVGALSRYGYSFDEAQEQILKFGTESERAAVLVDVVGQSVGGMNLALAQTDDGKMRQLNNTLNNTQQAVGQMANEWKAQMMGQMLPSVDTLSTAFLALIRGEGSIEALADSFEGVFNEIGNIIQEFIPKVLELGINIIKALASGLSNNVGVVIETAVTTLNQFASAILETLPVILDAGFKILLGLVEGIIKALPDIAKAAVEIINTLAKGIGDSLPTLIPAAAEAITTIVKSLIDSLPQILDTALKLVEGLAEGIINAIPVLIKALPEVIDSLVKFFIGAIPQIIETGIKLLTSLVEALPEIINTILEAIPKIIDSLVTAVIESIPQIVDAGVSLLVSLIQNLPEIITTVVEAIPKIVLGFVEAIIGNIDKIIEAGVKLLVSLVENTPQIIIEVVKAIPQIITGIVTAIIESIPKIVQAGSDLIKGLWQGISNVTQWIMDKIRGFMNSVVSGIKSFFGISSPSTLFAGIGRNLGEGIGVGFEDVMEQVGRDMQNAIPTDFNLDPRLRGTGGVGGLFDGAYSAGATPYGSVVQHISITSPKALSEKEAAREFRNMSRKLALGVT